MFTGIVEDRGTVGFVRSGGDGAEISVRPRSMDAGSLATGESVAVNGVCLTVVSAGGGGFVCQMSRETLSKTTMSSLGGGSTVNLERSVRPDGLMGGHIVTGHIDGVGTVTEKTPRGNSVEFWFSLPGGFMRYVAPKGCISLDGVSLTVNEVTDAGFSVNIIPHTLSHTTFSSLAVGGGVNFECDIVAKYIERLAVFGGGKTS